MSLSLLLTPNNMGPFFMSTITFTTLTATNINTTNINAVQILTQKIDATGTGGDLDIGTTNAGQIFFGNTANSTSFNFSNAGAMLLPKANSLSPYSIASSGIEIVGTVNLSGAVNTGSASYRIRRIGNWVDLYVYFNNSVPVVTNTAEITLANVVPTGYNSTTGMAFITEVLDSGVSAIPILGSGTLDTSGNITLERFDGNNWTAGQNIGFNSFTLTYTVV